MQPQGGQWCVVPSPTSHLPFPTDFFDSLPQHPACPSRVRISTIKPMDETNPVAHKVPPEGFNAPQRFGHHFSQCTFNKEAHILGLTDPTTTRQEYAEGCNITQNFQNSFSQCNFHVVDQRKTLLEWLSPLEVGRRHWVISTDRVAGVGDWLVLTNQFAQWREADHGSAKRVLFCYGNPGVGKTYLRYG